MTGLAGTRSLVPDPAQFSYTFDSWPKVERIFLNKKGFDRVGFVCRITSARLVFRQTPCGSCLRT